MTAATILWRRLDRPGHEAARLAPRPDGQGWRLSGTAALLHDGRAVSLAYTIDTDEKWTTESARVIGWLGEKEIDLHIDRDARGRWHLDGIEQPQVAGAIDVDLNFSPSTNLLPIRRLALAIGQEVQVHAAWLRFPSFTLEPLSQLYRRTGDSTYRYESAGGRFTADLEVDPAGFPTTYPGLAIAEGTGS